MRATLLSITALLCSTLSATAAVNTDYSFQTEDAFKATRHNKKLRRARRALNNGNGAVVPSIMDSHVTSVNVKHAASKEAVLAREDSKIWNRLLDEEMSMNTRAPSFAPVAASPVADNAPTGGGGGGGNCPTSIEIDCVTVDGSTSCTNINTPPGGTTGDACFVEVEFSYSMTNNGDDTERIYSLVITRGGDTTDITTTFPVTDLAPGESALILQNAVIDICEGGSGAFDTEAAFTTGPPCDVEVAIACESEDGDECRALPQAGSPDQCLIDIEYTYTVTNTGIVDANIILFTRTRNGEFRDLIGLLDDTFLPLGDVTEVSETEEIDRCVQQSFATNTIVAQIPNADLLCDDVKTYP